MTKTVDMERAEIIADAKSVDAERFADESVDSGPGRLDGASDRELTVALDILAGVSAADEEAGSVDYGEGNAQRFGRFILWTDSQGFISAETFESPSDAIERMAELIEAESMADDEPEPSTEDVLAEMLTENTGRHMLDSGGAYGRAWERNKDRDIESFKSEPESVLEARVYSYGDSEPSAELGVTHSVFHFLSQCLEYDAKLDRKFDRFCDRPENKDSGYLELMQEFPAYAFPGESVGGIYGDSSGPVTVNTYNGEDLLSQAIQYCYWEIDGEGYALLQIHGGCDVRGGYTRPRAFRADIEGDSGVGIMDNERFGIYCDHCSAIWSNDSSGEWNGADYASHIVPDVFSMKALEGNAADALTHCTDTLANVQPSEQGKLIDVPAEIVDNSAIEADAVLVIDSETPNVAYCPVCGTGHLNAGMY